MKNKTTELVFIIDKSGSMHGLEKDTVGGYNSMLEKQKREDGECYVSTVLFNDSTTVVHDRKRLFEVSALTEEDYCTCGCTALLDALGGAIRHIGNIHKYARAEDVPERCIFVIITDGMENASRRFTKDDVKRMIERQKERFGWEFLFLGANIDAVEAASSYGISEDRAVNYHADSEGTRLNYEVTGEAISAMRGGAAVSGSWKARIEKDYNGRKKKSIFGKRQ